MASTKMSPVQEKELGVLKEVVKVLEANGLHYCAVGGTCLGAVRHKGFIPWDDDIDIVIPRQEYELFRAKLYTQLPKHLLKLDCDCEESPSYSNMYLKIYDSTTSLIETNSFPDSIIGAFVDVFPLDGRPDELWRRNLWYAKYVFLILSNRRRRKPKRKITSPREFVKEVYGGILKKLFRYNYFTDKLQALLSKYDISQCETAIWNGAGQLPDLKRNFNRSLLCEWFTDTVPAPFEDMTIQIPRKYHDYLTTHLGDYMQLPPENERWSGHNVVISDMETPCKYYAGLVAEGKMDQTGQIVKERAQQ